MSVLSKKELLEYLKDEKITFDPQIDQYQLQPHSIDLRLGYSFYMPKKWKMTKMGREIINFDYLDENRSSQDNFDLVKLKSGQFFELLPKEFIIASSLEKINLNDNSLMANLGARSSILRRGIFIANGAIDVKYNGTLTFPIINNTETQIIKLYPGERICHLTFKTLSSPVSDDDAKIHGCTNAKYLKSTPYGLESRVDSAEEINLIKKEDGIRKLKDQYKI